MWRGALDNQWAVGMGHSQMMSTPYHRGAEILNYKVRKRGIKLPERGVNGRVSTADVLQEPKNQNARLSRFFDPALKKGAVRGLGKSGFEDK